MDQIDVELNTITIGGSYPPLILSAPTVVGDATPGTLTLASPGTLITVGTGVNLTLGGSLNLVGLSKSKPDETDNTASLVRVNDGGNLTLADQAVIRDNTNTNANACGGGVYVAGTFTMSGGEIRKNSVSADPGIARGGGVYVEANGKFTMSDGEIRENSVSAPEALSSQGGGVYVAGGGTFDMSGGEIRKNLYKDYESNGGGVFVAGTFTMSDGVIGGNQSNNPGGGVGIESGRGAFAKTGGIIYGNDGTENPDNNTNMNSGDDSNFKGGHAVAVTDYVPDEDGNTTLGTKRNETAGKGDNLFYNAVGEDGKPIKDSGWDPQQ
jgi:hypothetical protein